MLGTSCAAQNLGKLSHRTIGPECQRSHPGHCLSLGPPNCTDSSVRLPLPKTGGVSLRALSPGPAGAWCAQGLFWVGGVGSGGRPSRFGSPLHSPHETARDGRRVPDSFVLGEYVLQKLTLHRGWTRSSLHGHTQGLNTRVPSTLFSCLCTESFCVQDSGWCWQCKPK